jgi:CRISPR-associated protein Csb2
MGDFAPPEIHGHDCDRHAAFLGLPDVGHAHADGHLLGVAVVLPAGADKVATMIALRHTTGFLPPGQLPPIGLSRRRWARPSQVWATVTPTVLDRYPRRGLTAERVIGDSLVRQGYPRPVVVEVGNYSPLKGAAPSVKHRPRRGGMWMHAVVEFDKPVTGPLLLGRERHFGLGLCAPLGT